MKNQINWQPQHFPKGTVVRIKGFKRVEKDVVTNYEATEMQVTVNMVIQNGISSWLIQTDEMNDALDLHRSYNFDHIHSIVKRGEGPLVVSYIHDRHPSLNNKLSITDKPLNKRRYYWMGVYEIFYHLVNNTSLPKELCLKEEFMEFFMKQSFVRKQKMFFGKNWNWYIYSADKKKARRFFQQNVNRWIKPMKQVRIEAEEEAKKEYDEYCRDMDVDYHNSLPSIAQYHAEDCLA